MKKVELIIHPVRFRIMQTLTGGEQTTQGIAEQMPDVPKSSIYRHIKLLLDNGLLSVSDTNLIKGIQEKTYQLADRPYLSSDDMAGLSAEDHLSYFTTYLLTVLQGFSDYLAAAETGAQGLDLTADRVGYTELMINATPEEMDLLSADLNAAVMKLIENKPGDGRRRRKLAFVIHPADQ